MTITNPRSLAGLTATAASADPAVIWRETVGHAGRTLALTGTLAAREVSLYLGASGNNVTGDLDGALTLTGSTTGTAASGTLTFLFNTVLGKIITIGTRVYTFVSALTAANQVLVGASASASLDNLIAAINGAAGAGTLYGTGTVAHAKGTAAAGSGDTMVFTAGTIHSSENSIATLSDVTGGSWGAATLAGGVTPCVAEGLAATDPTGAALPSITSLQGVEVRVFSGAVNLTIGTKVATLPIPNGGVFHLAAEAMTDPGALTVAATAADTEATVTILYK